jgi:uncharacterized membrane protein YgaE (UPF0421/DUF939 family)
MSWTVPVITNNNPSQRGLLDIVGIRVIKTALAATVAVYVAWFAGLEFYMSAGILAILSVEVTRKKNVQSAVQRLLASLVGLTLAVMLFEVLGYHLWVLGLFVAVAFPLLARIHLKDGIVTGAFIVFHVFEEQQVSPSSLWNEVLLLLIGIGTATFINLLYMPRAERELRQLRFTCDAAFAVMFGQVAAYLRTIESTWNGADLIIAEQVVMKGLVVARRELENEWRHAEPSGWLRYFEMRHAQLDMIRQMLVLTAQISLALPQGQRLAECFETLTLDVREDHYTGLTERNLYELEQQFRSMQLPQTRAEFEARSAMLQLMVELKRYLAVARDKKTLKTDYY